MKNVKKRIISLIAAISIASTLFGGFNTPVKVSAKEVDINQKMKELLLKEVNNGVEIKDVNRNEAKTEVLDQNEVVTILVQLEEQSAVDKTNDLNEAMAKEDEVKKSQNSVIEQVQNITGTEVIKKFGYLVNGFSIEGKRKDIEQISKIDGVKSAEESVRMQAAMSSAKQIEEAAKVWQDYGYKGKGMVISVIDTGLDTSHKDFQNIDSSTIKINESKVSKFIEQNGYGKYYSAKIPFGYSYADRSNDVKNNDENHGTHVAGICAASGSEDSLNAVMGVAPEAQILAMKACNSENSFVNADVIAAIEDSVKLGADVINMSLGMDTYYAGNESLLKQAIDKATEAGVICVKASGNSQISTTEDSSTNPTNPFKLKDTSIMDISSEDSFTVASSENLKKVVKNTLTFKSNTNITKSFQTAGYGIDNISTLTSYYQMVDCNLGTDEDFSKVNVRNKIALIKRGITTFSEKYNNAIKNGAVAVVVINNTEGIISMQIDSAITKPVFCISNIDGAQLLKANVAGSTFNISVTNETKMIDNENAGQISKFSSWGPSPDLELMPEITAPGGDIYSTVNDNGYECLSGTSMAAPNVSGGQALILQSLKQRGLNLIGSQLTSFLKNTTMNTAEPLMINSSVPYSPRVQGAGELRIEKAIKNDVIVTDERGKASLALKNIGQTKNFKINIKNYGNEPKSYDISNTGLFTETVKDKVVTEKVIEGASLTVSEKMIVVNPGETKEIMGVIVLPNGFEKQNFVEGYIKFESHSEDSPSLSIPLLAFYGDYGDEAIIDQPKGNTSSLTNATGVGEASKNYKFVYYGQNADGTLDQNKTAFSPGLSKAENGTDSDSVSLDGTQDTILANTYFLRNAKSYKIQILDSNKRYLTNEVEYFDTMKNTYEKFLEGPITNFYKYYYEWDGKIFDTATGKKKLAPDGQYYVRMTAKGYTDAAKEQVIDIPVKLDTVAPTLEIKSAVYNNGYYDLTWTGSDTTSGVADSAIAYVNGDISTLVSIENITQSNGLYTGRMKSDDIKSSQICLLAMDNAGNMSGSYYEVYENEAVAFYNFTDNQRVGNSTDEFYGAVASGVSKIVINNNEVAISNDKQFQFSLNLNEGSNIIPVQAYTASGELVFNKSYTINLDTSAPVITSVSPIKGTDSYVTQGSSIDLTINTKDQGKVSGVVYNSSNYLESDDLNIEPNGSTTVKIPLKDGFNDIAIYLRDDLRNSAQPYTIKVIKVKDTSAINAGFSNIYDGKRITKTDQGNGIYEVKGYVTASVKDVKINGTKVSVNSDNSFSQKVTLVEGENKVSLQVTDYNGKEVCNTVDTVYLDTKEPLVTFTNLPSKSSDGYIHVNNENFTLKGSVSEKVHDYSVNINEKQILRTGIEVYGQEDKLTREFSTDITLKSGKNVILVVAKDEAFNEGEQYLTIYCDTEPPTGDFNNIILIVALIGISSVSLISQRKKII